MNRRSIGALLALALLVGTGCKNRHKGAATLAELSPPKDAPAWESRFAVAFDDSYTPTSVNLQGRAPKDARTVVIVCSGGNIDDELLRTALQSAD